MSCTLMARAGCVACQCSKYNLDGSPALEPLDIDAGETRCPRCGAPLSLCATRSGAFVAIDDSGQVHRHPVAFVVAVGQMARVARRTAVPVLRVVLDV